ncbi:MAG: glucosamine-6-phosphate deaminase [Clostridia bacterium]|nr:glucosamine-6-phosphate deaminase [Clostridia bacterium]
MRMIVSENAKGSGKKAAELAARLINSYIKRRDLARIVLSTGASQFEFLEALIQEDIDWSRVEAFHLDEYIGLPIDHPASFRKYIKERFADRVHPKAVHYVEPEGNVAENIAALTKKLTEKPIDVAFIGIGENGHIAFNDPPADFETEKSYIVVDLDEKCRRQQLGEGWFPTLEDVPRQAISMTVSQIMKAKHIISVVPHAVKANAIKATMENDLTPAVPATMLKQHRACFLFLDQNSASLIDPDKYTLKPMELPIRELSPEDGHYFFGYYDLQPYDSTGKRHLCHKVQFTDRLPEADDVAELGYIDVETRTFHKIAETTAWNFQQGAMLQWYGDDHILYNTRTEEGFKTAITHCETGETVTFPYPSANVSADGRYSLCINLSRVFDFRPGYGYAGIPDPVKDVKAPDNDGVWLQDLKTGETKLIVTYEQIAREFPQPPHSDRKLVINHITFNPSADRFLMLVRDFPGPKSKHQTLLLTSDLEGNLFKLTDYAVNSHYHWKNDRELVMVYSGKEEPMGLYLMTDLTEKRERIEHPALQGDIHCIYSPDRRYIIGDGYPDLLESKRSIVCYDTETGHYSLLASVYSHEFPLTDLRCDLHNRWRQDGKRISFDSNATGRRTIHEIDVEKLFR